jgi:hypothetical protein
MILKSAEKEEVIKENACRFYKFLIRLWRDEILAENDNWNEYFIFRMRHFYWIDPEVCMLLLQTAFLSCQKIIFILINLFSHEIIKEIEYLFY